MTRIIPLNPQLRKVIQPLRTQDALEILEKQSFKQYFSLVSEAVVLLQQGCAVAIPTETVYGLAADATSEKAITEIYRIKNRPSDNPLIVHVSSLAMLREFLINKRTNKDEQLWPTSYNKLMAEFWPGPLTLLFDIGDKRSVAARMPAHLGALAIIDCCGFPLSAPSANISGRPSPTSALHVYSELNGRIPIIIDGGICTEGLESTVLSCLDAEPVILRPGTITTEQIEQVLGRSVILDMYSETPKAPGMKYRHYAPRVQVHVVEFGPLTSKRLLSKIIELQDQKNLKIGVFTSTCASFEAIKDVENVVIYNSKCAHAELFSALHYFDEQKDIVAIVVEGVEETHCGRALMNRIRKAAS